MFLALIDGWRSVRRCFGIAVLSLLVNFSLAALLAVPLALSLERDLRNQGATMIYHLDYGVWSEWNDSQSGYAKSFAPDILGMGLVFKSAFALLSGELPAGLFRAPTEAGDSDASGLNPLILGLGIGYLALQTFLLGGVLGVFREGEGRWSVPALLGDAGLYVGRLLRVALLALVVAAVVFALDVPLARWVD